MAVEGHDECNESCEELPNKEGFWRSSNKQCNVCFRSSDRAGGVERKKGYIAGHGIVEVVIDSGVSPHRRSALFAYLIRYVGEMLQIGM
jgi:hypothetical protein